MRREESSPLSLPARGARAALMRTASTKATSPLAAVLPTALESDSEADSLEDEEQFKARRCAGLSHLGADVVQPSQAQIRACAEWTLLGAARGIRRLRGAGAHARTGMHAALLAPVALHRSAALPTGAVHRPAAGGRRPSSGHCDRRSRPSRPTHAMPLGSQRRCAHGWATQQSSSARASTAQLALEEHAPARPPPRPHHRLCPSQRTSKHTSGQTNIIQSNHTFQSRSK